MKQSQNHLAHYHFHPNCTVQSQFDINIEGGFYSFSGKNCEDTEQKVQRQARIKSQK